MGYNNEISEMTRNFAQLYAERDRALQELSLVNSEKTRLEQENERLKQSEQEGLEINAELEHYLACMTEQRNKLKLALEEIMGILDKSCNQCKNEYLSEDYCSGQGDCFEIRQVINEVLK